LDDPRVTSYDQPHDIIVLSDPPGARIVVDAETLAVSTPLTVRHTRKRHFGIPDAVFIHALAIAPGQCSQHRLISYALPLPDSIVFRMSHCPNPDQDFSRVFTIDEIDDVGHPERLGGPIPFYPPGLQRAYKEGTVIIEVVIDTTGTPEPQSVRALVASDSGFIPSARTTVLGSAFKPGRVLGRKVRTLVTIPITYRVNH
jgi:TonB family protein